MAKFNAKNDLYEIRDLMIERARYKVQAFDGPEGLMGPEQVVDFNHAERIKYGRVNRDGNPIIPKQSVLKTVASYGSSGNTVLLVNFVAEAFADLKTRMNKACRLGIISTSNPYLSTVEAERGFVSSIKLYDEYIVTLLSIYNNVYLKTSPKLGKIIAFDGYVKEFINFSKSLGAQDPITFTGWYRSKHSSIFSSGLAVDIAGLAIDDDAPKAERFLDTEEWEYFSSAAKYHGFSIFKNAPWILVADLRSPAMQQYMQRYGYSTIKEFFAEKYSLVMNFEIDRLKDVFVQSYNNFARGNPYHKSVKACQNYLLKQTIIHRRVTNINIVNNKYNNNIMYNIYAALRNIEEGMPFKKSDMNRIVRKSSYFLKKLGPKESLKYINEQFRSLYKFKDGTTHAQQKILKNKKDFQEQPPSTTALSQEHVSGVDLPSPMKGSY